MTETPEPAISRLGSAAATAEQGFLAAGRSLEAAVGVLDRLAARFSAYTAALTGGALSQTRSDLAAAGTHVATLAGAREADHAALATLGTIVAAAAQRIAALQPITGEIEVLALSTQVVAAGMGTEAASFGSFAGDIRGAARHARNCLAEAGNALHQVDAAVSAARAEAEAFSCEHGDAMRMIPARIAANLRSLSAQQQRVAEAVATTQRQSEAVRRHVAEQIMALQLGDITRQRLEHVQQAVQILAAPLRPIGALLAAQVSDTAEELLREGDRIDAGLRSLADAARAIGQLSLRVHADAGSVSFVAALEADIRQTVTLFRELSAGDSANDLRMQTVLDAAGTLATGLASVQSVQEDIRIMGLNASIKCGHLGAIGRPLAVVAQELRTCSGRFGVSASAVLAELQQLRPIAGALCDPSRRGEHAGLVRSTDALLAPLQQLQQVEHEVGATLELLQDDAGEVGQLVEAAIAQFAARHDLAATLREAAAEFAAWDDDKDDPTELFSRIAAAYTMARERTVHTRFAPLPEQAQEEAEDVLF